jgi:hypothetical protein
VIRVRDNPALWWLLAVLFVGAGIMAVYLGIAHALTLEWWQGPLAALMGLSAVSAGVWWAWRSPLSAVSVSPVQREVTITQFGLFGRRIQTIPFAQIDDVVVERQSDDEGALVVRPALLLRDGSKRVPLSALWQHDVKGITKSVATLRAAIRSSPFTEVADE